MLVRRIQAMEFVEMKELLPDNLALAERLEALPVRLGQPAKPAEQREIGSLITWVSSFTTYVAIMAEAQPGQVRDMLAYMRLILREAYKHGGHGWLTYSTGQKKGSVVYLWVRDYSYYCYRYFWPFATAS